MVTAREVVVLGSGAAGMAAATAAATAGAHVTVLEAADRLGGTTAWSGGGIWIPVNRWAREVSDDTPERASRYLRNVALGDGDPVLLDAYVEQGARVVAAMEHRTPLRWRQLIGYPDYHAELDGGVTDGRSLEIDPVRVPLEVLETVRTDPYGRDPVTINEANSGRPTEDEIARRKREGIVVRGRGLVGALAARVLECGGEIRRGVRATRLVIEGDAVVGVEVDGERVGGDVIIATGGFERDPALVRAFLRGPMVAPGSPSMNVGDGLRMGMAAGAALGNMSEAWWAPALAVPDEQVDGAPFFRMLFQERALPGGVVVDSRGQRFADEAANYNDFGRSLQAFDPGAYAYPRVPSWLVFDATGRATHQYGPLTPDTPDPDWLAQGDSIEALAARIDVPAAALRATIERFNEQAAAGTDEDFGRGSYAWDQATVRRAGEASSLRPLTEAPFYALQVLPGCLGTKGGLRTDAQGRVPRADGSGPIPRLFAAGNAAANPFGHAYPGAGGTIGPAVVFGWCAGEAAAAG